VWPIKKCGKYFEFAFLNFNYFTIFAPLLEGI
jgi:hypothetical protein